MDGEVWFLGDDFKSSSPLRESAAWIIYEARSLRQKQLAMELLILAMWFSALSITAGNQSMTGFISIDCGYAGKVNYEEYDGIVYSPDDMYIDSGENHIVSRDTSLTGLLGFYRTLRSFPQGIRNCYSLKPVQKGRKYLVRAEFEYGNFDGRNSPPAFDLYLGIHLWDSVSGEYNFSRLEMIAVSPGDSIQICLVNKGRGTPYISVLELRPLGDSMYPLVNSSHVLLLRGDRTDYGNNGFTRYPDDPFDRFWFASSNEQNWPNLNTTQTINASNSEFRIPSVILGTAVTTRNVSESLNFKFYTSQEEIAYVFMHFAEIEQLKNNQVREFDIYADNSMVSSAPYRPSYLSGNTLSYSSSSGTNYSLRATKNSTLPPIINALETYVFVQLSGLPTNENDEKAITKIKEVYKMKNWQGDPCAPMEFTWEGLNCSYIDSLNPRIISLNLSRRGLEGEISPYIANLTGLVSLDLSNNNLTGGIPDELAQLAELKVLNLADNKLSGQVPFTLLEKSENNTLSISVDGNANLCNRTNSCKPKGNNNKIFVPIVASVSVTLLLFLITMIAWRIRGRRQKSGQEISRNVKHNLYSESNQFTFEEIVHMTKNFQQQIGKGGFGIVYHGQLKTGREVAVKMISKTSSQGAKEFEAEAQILTRVHHRNLVSLVGYCSDPDNLSLVYEFMAHGNLAKHLSDKNVNNLNWNARLKIALDVAQGLEYLHSFCKPPIVHRDVKTTNILLSQSFEAKLADFGLSRLFQNDEHSYLSTTVAGTPGYLDPEYYQNSTLNEKSDIYSFGIVLLELITGKPPIMNGVEKMSIVSWVKSKIGRGDITAIVDQRICEDWDLSSFWKFLDVAILCTNSPSIQRPSMSDVVVQLKESVASMSLPDISKEVNFQEQCLVDEFSIALRMSLNPLAR